MRVGGVHAFVFVPWDIYLSSEKLQNESSPNYSIFSPGFCPEFCSEFSPNFSRIFRASFRVKRRPEKIHQKSPGNFSMQNSQANTKKKIHKIYLGSRQSNIVICYPGAPCADTIFLGITDIFSLKEGSVVWRRKKAGSR